MVNFQKFFFTVKAIFLLIFSLQSVGFATQAGDVNSSGTIETDDVILSLRVLSGYEDAVSFSPENDVGEDSKIALEEAIYNLRRVQASSKVDWPTDWVADNVGNTYYVDANNGDDLTGTGSITEPFKTYTKVRSLLQEGDTALFFTGNYGAVTEGDVIIDNTPVDVFTDWVTIAAVPGHTPTFTSIRFGGGSSNYYTDVSPSRIEGTLNVYMKFVGIHVEDGFKSRGGKHIQLLNSSVRRVPPWNGSAESIDRAAIGMAYSGDIRVEGCDITESGWGIFIGAVANRVIVRNNHIHHISQDGINVVSAQDVLIEGNVIHNLDDGVEDPVPPEKEPRWNRHADAIQMYTLFSCCFEPDDDKYRNVNVTVRSNKFYNMEEMGIMLNGGADGYPYKNLVIENNIFGPSGGPAFHAWVSAVDGLIFRHNTIIYFPEGTEFESRYRTVPVTSNSVSFYEGDIAVQNYNNIFVNAPKFLATDMVRNDHNLYVTMESTLALGRGSIVLDSQQFANPSAMDGILLPNSPAIDGGTRLSKDGYTLDDYLSYDYYATSRDSRPDMGAVEVWGRTPLPESTTPPMVPPSNPTYFKDDFADTNFERDPWLATEDTIGLSWEHVNSEYFETSNVIRYNNKYANKNTLSPQLCDSGNTLTVTEDSWKNFKLGYLMHTSHNSGGEYTVLLYKDIENYYYLDLSSGIFSRKLNGVDTVLVENTTLEAEDHYHYTPAHEISIQVTQLENSITFDIYIDGVNTFYTDADTTAVALFKSGGAIGFSRQNEQSCHMARYGEILVQEM